MKKLILFFLLISISLYSQERQNKSWDWGNKFSISGFLTYDNSINSPLSGTTILLKNGSLIIDSTKTDNSGYYSFLIPDNGKYTLLPRISKDWGPVSQLNRQAILENFKGTIKLEGLRLKAADVNNNGSPNSADALALFRRFTYPNEAPFPGGDWISETPEVLLDGNNVTQNIKAICKGDVLGSYKPNSTKITGTLVYDNSQKSPLAKTMIYLKEENVIVDSTITDFSGRYSLTAATIGNFTLSPKINKPWGPISLLNSLELLKYISRQITLDGLRQKAADIDNSGKIETYDALLLELRLVNGGNTAFPGGDWISETPVVIVGSADAVQDIKSICRGDVLGSHLSVPVTISGTVNYLNPTNSPITFSKIYLSEGGKIIDSTRTDIKGQYSFLRSYSGKYILTPQITKPAAPLNALGFLFILKCSTGEYTVSGLNLKAGDLDNSGAITAYDVYLYKTAFENGKSFTDPWITETPEVAMDGKEVVQNIKAICKGDVGGWYIPLTGKGIESQSLAKTLGNSVTATVPDEFALAQNYPNPFNPETTIRYSLPLQSSVQIYIYNMLGQKVTELFNGVREAGNYEINFRANGISSGTYIYSIKANPMNGAAGFSASKKLIYLK